MPHSANHNKLTHVQNIQIRATERWLYITHPNKRIKILSLFISLVHYAHAFTPGIISSIHNSNRHKKCTHTTHSRLGHTKGERSAGAVISWALSKRICSCSRVSRGRFRLFPTVWRACQANRIAKRISCWLVFRGQWSGGDKVRCTHMLKRVCVNICYTYAYIEYLCQFVDIIGSMLFSQRLSVWTSERERDRERAFPHSRRREIDNRQWRASYRNCVWVFVQNTGWYSSTCDNSC